MKRNPRIIEMLRVLFPGRWAYKHEHHEWVHESGIYVYPRAQSAPRYPGDDENWVTVYQISYPDMTMETVGRSALWLRYEAAKRNP